MFNYTRPMKISCTFVLTVILITLLAPVHVTLAYRYDNDAPHLMTLDVCGASSPFISANSEMPSLYESLCNLCIPDFAGFHDASEPAFRPFIMTDREERPPRIPPSIL